jgi:hypothetical protein
MFEERKQPRPNEEAVAGDLPPEGTGVFEDWDNPEDEEWNEEAPEGWDDEDDDGSYIPDESDPDYDLSEAAGYAEWEPKRQQIIPQWVIVVASLLLIFAILVPLLIRIS